MAAPSAAAEAAVKKLARIGGNTICPNCGTEKKFGFGTVCMKFLTFVCNECKSSHQAVSHRCKSLTMSSWTEGEVLELRTVGGNDRARATWLATAPPPGQNGRPRSGSPIDVFKSFIVEVYERKKYYREFPSGNDVDVTSVSQQRLQSSPLPAAKPSRHQQNGESKQRQVTQLSNPPVVVDLLDFGSFDTPLASAPAEASSNVVAVTDPFSGFDVSPIGIASSTPQPQTATFDPFGISGSSNLSNMHDFASMNTSSNICVVNGKNVESFDPFGIASVAVPLPLEPRKIPIMNNSKVNNAKNIEMMMSNNSINAGIMNNGYGGLSMHLHSSTPNNNLTSIGTGLPYHQQSIMQPSTNSAMMMNMVDNVGQARNNPGIVNTSMAMNGATNIGLSMSNSMYNNFGIGTGSYSGGGSTMMMQNGMGRSGGMVTNMIPGGNSMNRISTNFDGRSQQTTKTDPFANLGL